MPDNTAVMASMIGLTSQVLTWLIALGSSCHACTLVNAGQPPKRPDRHETP